MTQISKLYFLKNHLTWLASFMIILNSSCTKAANEPLPISDSLKIGLVAHYVLDRTVNDLAGNNGDITYVNTNIQPSLRGNFSTEFAAFFAGNPNSYIKCTLSNHKAVIGALSISFWAKETGPGAYSPRLFEFWPGNYGVGFYWFNWYQNKVKWAGPDFELASTEILNRNQWYHFVVSVDIYSIKLYCNGRIIARQNQLNIIQPLSIQLAPYFEIGRLAQRPADAFEGGMRDFRIYNRSLSQNEIDYLYNH